MASLRSCKITHPSNVQIITVITTKTFTQTKLSTRGVIIWNPCAAMCVCVGTIDTGHGTVKPLIQKGNGTVMTCVWSVEVSPPFGGMEQPEDQGLVLALVTARAAGGGDPLDDHETETKQKGWSARAHHPFVTAGQDRSHASPCVARGARSRTRRMLVGVKERALGGLKDRAHVLAGLRTPASILAGGRPPKPPRSLPR